MSDLLKMEIDLNQIRNNILNILEVSKKGLIPVIKSNAYNLGDITLMELIDNLNLDYAAVVDMQEALRLLNYNPNFRLLILNSCLPADYEYLDKYPNITISVNNLNDLKNIDKHKFKRILKVHFQIDTGMNRLGFTNYFEYERTLNSLLKRRDIKVEGIYSHFSSLKNSEEQLKNFIPYTKTHDFEMVHLASTETYKNLDFGNYVRVGLDIYGVCSLRQSIKVSCYPLAINKLKKGTSLGYNETYHALAEQLIAVLPIGYANGFRRSLREYEVLVKNKLYPVVGLICMNHTFVLVDEDINLDSEFVITSKEHPIENMADFLNTTPHEILCMLKIKQVEYIC